VDTIKKDIRLLSPEELKQLITAKGEPAFRAKQVYDWLWKKHVRSFDQMSNIPDGTKNFLKELFDIKAISIQTIQKSKDRTIKTAFLLSDGKKIEGVLIPSENRTTACVSSQVGCPLSCNFCATGKSGWTRNLGFPEIFDQVILINQQSIETMGMPLSNIVFMGMGEPLLNYDQVLKAIELITSPGILNFSPSRITVSTVGIVKMIRQLADDNVKFNLAISLHAATDKKRSLIIPINEHNSLKDLTDALKYFHDKTKTRITLEYLLLDNFNDSLDDAWELAEFCKNFPCKINIIEYNPIDEGIYKNTTKTKEKTFIELLKSKNIIVNIRKSKGKDIAAACGQLAGKGKI
jgi:23S rRNA (adenine2503-C2)-methyltransferase